ncbi:MAG: histidine--tRNA ligase [Candidatus Omnitrophica bacterium]|nr:histidine--tRNA ligase [Candidatus Omnitrophota bacterium]
MPNYTSLRGMPDILPSEAEKFRFIEEKARDVFKLFDFSEIRTPFLEKTEVFARGIGESTDIVEKEMYSFLDRGGKHISLRPEGTASIIRSYVENKLYADGDISKLFYVGPMFRAERPQKGRLRQFHQIGAEIIGGSSPYLDWEIIFNAKTIIESTGIKGFSILLNTLGCSSDREKYKNDLRKKLKVYHDDLCENCQRRIDVNVLRVLDCKNAGCKKVAGNMPVLSTYLCSTCTKEYDELKSILKETNIEFVQKNELVRGLDYYTGTVFEIVHQDLGSQDAIAAGGRYNNLVKEFGGPDVGATGYALGLERLILLLLKETAKGLSGLMVVPINDEFAAKAALLVTELRAQKISCDMECKARSLKSALRKANKTLKRYVVMIGEDEVKSGKYLIKDMESGEQEAVTSKEMIEKVKK